MNQAAGRPAARVVGPVVVLAVGFALAVVGPAQAQTFATADLAGTWSVFQLATPTGAVTTATTKSYEGTLEFNAAGAVTGGTLTERRGVLYTVTGGLALGPDGVVAGALGLDPGGGGDAGTLQVAEARMLANKHTIVGAATVLGDVGLLTLTKIEEAQAFGRADVAGDWNYHEVTTITAAVADEATWSNGTITFHLEDGCTDASLVFPGGVTRTAGFFG
jgi:hypothetical protein